MAGRVWEESEIQFIKDNFMNMTCEQMSQHIKRSPKAVTHVFNQLGLWELKQPKVNDKLYRLTIDKITLEKKYGQKISIAECTCECGKKVKARLSAIKSGGTKSCGCLKSEIVSKMAKEKNFKHGLCDHRLFSIWNGLKVRCWYKNSWQYHNYGGRGITICDEWLNFQNFYDWAMANGYQDHLTIDRKDNNKGYEPSNCRWKTPLEQANNKRTNRLITAFGETKTMAQWTRDERCKVKPFTIHYRLAVGWTPETALSTPPLRENKYLGQPKV